MKGLLIRPLPQAAGDVALPPAAQDAVGNLITFVKKRKEVDEYFEIYGDLTSVMKEFTPPDLAYLLFPSQILLHYEFPFLVIEEVGPSAYELVREVDLPTDLFTFAHALAVLNSERARMSAEGPKYFRRNYEQTAMAPVFSKDYDILTHVVLRGIKAVEKIHGELLRELKVLPTFANKDPAT